MNKSTLTGKLNAAACAAVMVAGVLVFGIVSAQAELVDQGDTTLDTETGLEWLDLTQTVNKSWNGILAGDGGFIADRYRVATSQEVLTLFEHAGIDPISGNHTIANYEPALRLLELLGCLVNCGADGYGNGLAKHVDDQNYVQELFFGTRSFTSGSRLYLVGRAFDWHEYSAEYKKWPFTWMGIYLVRDSVPELTCSGFNSPFDEPLYLSKKTKKTIPAKITLVDDEGYEVHVGDIAAPPVINVEFSGFVYGDGANGEDLLEPVGSSNDGNAFNFNLETLQWEYRLGTKQFSESGTYTVTVNSGDETEYMIDGSCTNTFTRSN